MQLEPMIAAAGRKVFDDPDWLYELKYDGFRALLVVDGADVRFISRRGSNLSSRLPELDDIGHRIKARQCVLDGEIIAGDGSIDSFRDLRHRYAKAGITELKPKDKVALKYVAFDVLSLNGRPLIGEPLSERKARLRDLLSGSPAGIVAPKSVKGKGAELFAEAEKRGFEGIMAKRLDSKYEPGKRSKSWLKFKSKSASEEMILRRDMFDHRAKASAPKRGR